MKNLINLLLKFCDMVFLPAKLIVEWIDKRT